MARPRLLLIDDDAELTELLKMMFEADGSYELKVENHSDRALEAAREFRPDLILLDVVMPGLDGGDVSALLQEDPELRETPVIVVSALVRNEDTGSGKSIQFRDKTMLPKPYKFEHLKKLIELRLEESR